MTGRFLMMAFALAAGVALASLLPGLSQSVRGVVGLASDSAAVQVRSNGAAHTEQGQARSEGASEKARIVLTDEQIAAAKIELVPVQAGVLVRRLTVPGSIVPHADRIARIAVKSSGTIAELRKKLGDPVSRDEVVAILESREAADAKSDYLATKLTRELQQELFERDKSLWEKRIAPEQQYLRSRDQAAQARMRFDIARQKLLALGLMEKDIAALVEGSEASLRRQEIRSPIAGRVVERKVDLGAAVGRDSLETELFVVVDLARVWVDLAVSPSDLPIVKEGQTVAIMARGTNDRAEGKIIFISPLIDKDTRSARVVAEIDNANGVWRPGSFITAEIAVEEQPASIAVPTSAIQNVAGEKVVFVRTPDGFEKRPVTLGRSDERLTEVVTGLQVGEIIAATNTFPLKAEFSKGAAED